MEVYVLKSAACLALLFAFYKLFLEHENMHVLKRFYLLGAIIASVVIPLVVFTEYIVVESSNTSVFSTIENNGEPIILVAEQINYLPYLFWGIYGAGFLFFSFKFVRNLLNILQKIRNNPIYKSNSFFHVLLGNPVTPHTFFNYIFLNKRKFENEEIPQEVLLHEHTHATQKHSIDILFIELLQVIFWFNPLVYMTKKAIKLNHEFLADQAVITKGVDPVSYQQILLAFSSNASSPAMANAINYSSIKKRLTVMKTHTSKRAAWLKTLILLPLLAVLVYGFSTTQKVEKISLNSQMQNDSEILLNSPEHLTARSISIEILNESYFNVDGIKTMKKDLYRVLESLHSDISKEQRDRIINIHVSSKEGIAYNDLVFIQKVATPYGYHRIVTPKEEIVRSKGNVPMVTESKKIQERATKEEIAEYNTLAKKYNAIDIEKRIIKLKDLQRLELIYKKMTVEQKEAAQPFPECLPPPPPMVSTSPLDHIIRMGNENAAFLFQNKGISYSEALKIVKEESNLDIQTKRFDNSNPIVNISKGDKTANSIKVYEGAKQNPAPPAPPVPPTTQKTSYVVNSRMAVTNNGLQQAPPPPPPPFHGVDNKVLKKYKNSIVLYVNQENIYLNGKKITISSFAKELDNHTKDWNKEDFKLYGLSVQTENVSDKFIASINKEYKKTRLAKSSSSKNVYIIGPKNTQLPPPPPPPPGPDQPLDHVVAMAKRGANFYFEKKSITSDKAIKLLKENPALNIQTRLQDPKPPTVYISKEGITIKD